MPRRPKKAVAEYKFHIDAYSPATIPMRRLSAYLTELAVMFGEESSVHFDRLEEGSTMPVVRVDLEAVPKIERRLHSVKTGEGPKESLDASRKIDEMLWEDNSGGILFAPSKRKVITFQGIKKHLPLVYGPFWQLGKLYGTPIKVGGEKEWVPIHLEDDREQIFICHAKRGLAKQIANCLFTTPVIVEGNAKWLRNIEGQWEMQHFTVQSFSIAESGSSLTEELERLRSVPGKWKELDDPLGELQIIRHNEIQ